GFLAGALDEADAREVGDLELGNAALTSAEIVAWAADAKVRLGELEAIVRVLEDLEALARGVGGILREEEAEALVGAAADTAAELMQLGEAEAVGAFDDHDGCVRDIDPNLNDGCGNKNV